MSGKNIQVAIKVRPLLKKEKETKLYSCWKTVNNSIQLIDNPSSEPFYFDHIFDHNESNAIIFDKVAKPIIDATLKGFNGTIFAYGQTSSGKTYTMLGDEKNPGVMVFAAKEIFKEILNVTDRAFLLRVGYIEIYNEKIYDLLNKSNQDLKIHENQNGDVGVNCTEFIIRSEDDMMEYLHAGSKLRKCGETNMNERSSRSHAIFRLIIESRDMDKINDDGAVQISHLNLVDLAGSERADQTGATGSRLIEGSHINRSLLSLSCVIKRLSENVSDQYINYRDSKLTRILQASLGGNALTAIICAINPTAIEETNSTLNFAMRAKTIKNKPCVNEVLTDAAMMKRLEKEISRLKDELEIEKHKNSKIKVSKLEKQIKEENLKIVNSQSIELAIRTSRRRTWHVQTIPEEEAVDLNPNEILKEIVKPEIKKRQRSKLKKKFSCPQFVTVRDEDYKNDFNRCVFDDKLDSFSMNHSLSDIAASQSAKLRKSERRSITPPPNFRYSRLETEFEELKEFTNLEKLHKVDFDAINSISERLKFSGDVIKTLEKEKCEHKIIISDLRQKEILFNDLELRYNDKNKDLEALEEKNLKLIEDIKSLEKKNRELEMESNILVGNEIKHEQSQKKLKLRSEELLDRINEKELEIKNLTYRIENMHVNLNPVECKNCINHEKKMSSLLKEVLDKETETNNFNIIIDKLKQDKSHLQKESDNLSTQLMDAIEESDILKKEIEKNKGIYSDKMTELKDQLENEKTNYSKNVLEILKEPLESLSDINNNNKILKETISLFQEKNIKYIKEIKCLNQEINLTNKKLENMNDENIQIKNINSKLNSDLITYELSIDAVQNELNAKNKELNQLLYNYNYNNENLTNIFMNLKINLSDSNKNEIIMQLMEFLDKNGLRDLIAKHLESIKSDISDLEKTMDKSLESFNNFNVTNSKNITDDEIDDLINLVLNITTSMKALNDQINEMKSTNINKIKENSILKYNLDLKENIIKEKSLELLNYKNDFFALRSNLNKNEQQIHLLGDKLWVSRKELQDKYLIIQQTEEECKSLKNSGQSLFEKIEKLQNDKIYFKDKITKMENEYLEKIECLSKEIECKNLLISENKNQIDNLENSILKFNQTGKDKTINMNCLEKNSVLNELSLKEIEEKNLVLINNQELIINLENNLKDKEENLKALTNSLNANESEKNKLVANLLELQSKLGECETKYNDLQIEFSTKEKEIVNIQKLYTNIENDNKILSEKNLKYEKDICNDNEKLNLIKEYENKIICLEALINKLNNEITLNNLKDKEENLKALTNSLNTNESEKNKLVANLLELQSKLGEYETKYNDLQIEFSTKEKEIVNIQKLYTNIENDNKILSEKNLKYEKDICNENEKLNLIKEYENKIIFLEELINKLNNEITLNLENIKNIEEKCNDLSNRLAAQNLKINELLSASEIENKSKAKIDLLEKTITQLHNQITSNIENYENQIKTLNEENSKTCDSENKCKTEIHQLNDKIYELEEKMKNDLNKIQSLEILENEKNMEIKEVQNNYTKKIMDLEKIYADKNKLIFDEMKALKEQLEQNSIDIMNYKSEIEKLKELLKDKNFQLNKTQKTCAETVLQLEDNYKSKIFLLDNTVKALKDELAVNLDTIKKNESEFKNLEIISKDKNLELKAMQNIFEQKYSDIENDYKMKINVLDTEIKQLKDQLHSSVNTIKVNREEIEQLNSLLNDKNAELNESQHICDKRISDLEKNYKMKIDILEAEIKPFKDDLASCLTNKNQYEEECLKLKNLLNEKNSELNIIEKNCEKNISELENKHKILMNEFKKLKTTYVTLENDFKNQNHQKTIDSLVGENNQLKKSNETLLLQIERKNCQKDRKSRRQSFHDESRQSLWNNTKDVAVLTDPTDQSCSCNELNEKLLSLQRLITIKNSKISTLQKELKNNPFTEEIKSLKKKIYDDFNESEKIRENYFKLKRYLKEKSHSLQSKYSQTDPERLPIQKISKKISISSQTNSNGISISIQTDKVDIDELRKDKERLKAKCQKLVTLLNYRAEQSMKGKENVKQNQIDINEYNMLKMKYDDAKRVLVIRAEKIEELNKKLQNEIDVIKN